MIYIHKLASYDLIFSCPKGQYDDFLESFPSDDEVEDYIATTDTEWLNPDWGRKWKIQTTLFSRLKNADDISFVIYSKNRC